MSFSIQRILSAVSRERGFAKPNRFRVIMTPPAGVGADYIDTFVDSVQIPAKSITSFEYPLNSLMNSVKHPNGFMNEDVTIVFNVTNQYTIKRVFDRWLNLIINPETYLLNYPDVYERDIRIIPSNENGEFLYAAILRNAYPISINNIELSNESTDTISKLSVTFTCTTVETV